MYWQRKNEPDEREKLKLQSRRERIGGEYLR